MTQVAKIQEIPKVRMLSVNEILPPPFKRVVVWGMCKSVSDLNTVYVARRWTGSNQSRAYLYDDYDWLTDGDRLVKYVTHWMPLPNIKA